MIMKKLSGWIILLLFLMIGVLSFFATGFLFSYSFFQKHETLTFILVNAICATVYGLLLFFLIHRK